MKPKSKLDVIHRSNDDLYIVFRYLRDGTNLRFEIPGNEWRRRAGYYEHDISGIEDTTKVNWR